MMRFGHRKGALKLAMEAAIRVWIDLVKKNPGAGAAKSPIEVVASPVSPAPVIIDDSPSVLEEALFPREEPVTPSGPPTTAQVIKAQMDADIAHRRAVKQRQDEALLLKLAAKEV